MNDSKNMCHLAVKYEWRMQQMTILQLKYVVAISTSASMQEASGKLYVS